jgi:hypothetical protein
MTKFLVLVLSVLAIVLATVTGCGTSTATSVNTGRAAADTAVPGTSAGDASAQLAALRVASPGPMTGYSRDQFGKGWADQGHSCNTREIVLQRQGQNVTTDPRTCRITAGTWISLYDGVTVHNPAQLDIDHLVPLGEAWKTGATTWTADQRQKFANDWQDGELVAVTAHSNRSKGDDPPPGYMPTQVERCAYARQWIEVKSTWHLTITQPEHDALAQMLGTCH